MEEKGIVFTRSASGLVRELSWWDVFIFVIAAPAASGIIFYSVSAAADYPGGSIPLGFVIGSAIFLPICALIAMTSVAMPRSGGLYICVSRVIDPTLGYLGGWMFFVGYGIAMGVLGYIVMGIMGGAIETSGIASGISFLTKLGKGLGGHTGKTIAGALWVIFFWAISLRGIRWIRNAMRVLFAFPLIATLIAVLYFIFTGPNGVESAFDRCWGTGVFQTVIDVARANGWTTPLFSWAATLGTLIVVIWAYTGVEAINYAGGEVKTPRTSMVRGFLWGCLAVGIMYIIVAYAVYYPFKEFIGAYDFLYDKHQDVLEGIMPAISPSVPFYAASIIGNVWIGVLVTAAIALWFVNSIPPIFLATSRLAFALAMDRAWPEKIADVNPKTGSPTWAIHLTAIVGLFGVLLMSQNVGVVLGILNITFFFIVWGYGLSAMLLPYLKPEIYERSPVGWKIGKVPLMVILGVITFAAGWFFVFLSVMEFTKPIMFVVILTMVIGMLIYLYQQVRNKRRGIDISKIYSEIPPE